jgi:membrane protease YdiL (CAAX protease family)
LTLSQLSIRYTVLLVLRYALIPQAAQLGVLLAISLFLEIARRMRGNSRMSEYLPSKLAQSATLAYMAYFCFGVLLVAYKVNWTVSPSLEEIVGISRDGNFWSVLSAVADLALATTALLWWRSSHLTLKDVGFRGIQSVDKAALSVALLLAVGVVVGSHMLGDTSFVGGAVREASPSSDRPVVFLWVWTVLVAPLSEEAFFRGMLQSSLKRYFPRAIAIILQALAFGCMHVMGGRWMALSIVAGLLLGCIYEATGTIFAAWLVHGIWNATVIAVALARAQP